MLVGGADDEVRGLWNARIESLLKPKTLGTRTSFSPKVIWETNSCCLRAEDEGAIVSALCCLRWAKLILWRSGGGEELE